MIPGFSGGRIASPRLVAATFWLGNTAALLRVGSVIGAPLLAATGSVGQTLAAIAFGLSGPLGLALAACLAVNLWPALRLRFDRGDPEQDAGSSVSARPMPESLGER
jgi:hypothetical protein